MSSLDAQITDAGGSPTGPDVVTQKRPRRRIARVLVIIGSSLAGLVLAAVIAFVVWANAAYSADDAAWQAVQGDDRIAVQSDGEFVVMRPAGDVNGEGLVFLAGARVDPDAYAATFVDTVAAGTTVVIVRPFLNLGILEMRDFDAFTAQAPDVQTWAVGGHSMGGVRACGYAQDSEVSALVLLASYCSDDVSERGDLDVLTVSGSEDALATPAKITDAAHLLPSTAVFVEIEGASHAQFGAYGPQDGDGEPTISDVEAREQISAALIAFFPAL